MSWYGLSKLLQAIPWKFWAALLALALVAWSQWYIYHRGVKAGESDVRTQWAASIERGRKELDRLRAQRAKITVHTKEVYVDRIKVVREKGQTLIQRIPALVPADACLLPSGWRLSHDHAAAGTVPDASAPVDGGAANAEAIAWRPWNTRPGTSGSADGGRELRPLPRGSRAIAGATGVDSGAAIR